MADVLFVTTLLESMIHCIFHCHSRYSLVKTIGDTAQEHFNWLADYLMVEGVNCQKMIIFCHK